MFVSLTESLPDNKSRQVFVICWNDR